MLGKDNFEYKVIGLDVLGWFSPDVKTDKVQKEFNKWGKKGWELISLVQTTMPSGYTQKFYATFKRKL